MSEYGPVIFPVSELIVANVVETLSGIGTAADYLNDLEVVEHRRGGDPPLRDGLAVVCAGAPRVIESPLGFDRYLMEFSVSSVVIEPDDAEPSLVRGRLYSVAADVRRALNLDLHRGGLAHYTAFDPDQVNEEGKPPAVMVSFKVAFDTVYNDPYRQS